MTGRGPRGSARWGSGHPRPAWVGLSRTRGKLDLGAKVPAFRIPWMSTSRFSKLQFYGAPVSWGKAALNENIPCLPC